MIFVKSFLYIVQPVLVSDYGFALRKVLPSFETLQATSFNQYLVGKILTLKSDPY